MMTTTSETTYRPVFRHEGEDGEDFGSSGFSKYDDLDEAVEHAEALMAKFSDVWERGTLVIEQTTTTTTVTDAMIVGSI